MKKFFGSLCSFYEKDEKGFIRFHQTEKQGWELTGGIL